MRPRTLACIAIGGMAALIAYLRVIRPWHMRWGATGEEIARDLPGDEIVRRPTFNATRAVTVNARPEEIWLWLVQMGLGKAGWYSYDWTDNFGRPSAEQIIPGLQRLEVGDFVPMGPKEPWGLYVRGVERCAPSHLAGAQPIS